MPPTSVLNMGAAGRDFHDFNVVFRDDPRYEVVAFTQFDTQNLGEIADLEATISNADPEVVVSGTPHDLARAIDVEAPIVRVRYDIREKGLTFEEILDRYADTLGL